MINNPKIVCCRLSNEEWEAFHRLCEENKINYQSMLHAIVIDVLVEEGYDALRCQQPERCEGGREASETCGATTP